MQILHARIMQMHILHSTSFAKNAMLFCINTRKPRRNDAHTQHMERRIKTLRNQTKKQPERKHAYKIK